MRSFAVSSNHGASSLAGAPSDVSTRAALCLELGENCPWVQIGLSRETQKGRPIEVRSHALHGRMLCTVRAVSSREW